MKNFVTNWSGIGSRESGVGNRESGVGSRESGVGNREQGNSYLLPIASMPIAYC
ncbi:MAG: hypothetical protein F6K55_35580 [Moorea sp. SIO4A3]|nr:hypothetical protein [Moorena sp. SIO4A3]